MEKILNIRIVVVLLIASLLSACGSAAVSNVNPTVPATSAPISAPTLSPAATANQNATAVSQPTPLATATAKASSKSVADACLLLTKADVVKVSGQAFEPAAGTGQYGVCAYTFKLSRIDLTISNTEGTQFMKTTRAKLAEMALDIPGLGDEALYNVNSSTLFVRKGEAVYLLSYLDSMVTQDDKIAKEKALAALLLSRLN